MIIEVAKILKENESLGDRRVCPYLSRYEVGNPPMGSKPEFYSFTVVCMGESCGRWNACRTASMP